MDDQELRVKCLKLALASGDWGRGVNADALAEYAGKLYEFAAGPKSVEADEPKQPQRTVARGHSED